MFGGIVRGLLWSMVVWQSFAFAQVNAQTMPTIPPKVDTNEIMLPVRVIDLIQKTDDPSNLLLGDHAKSKTTTTFKLRISACQPLKPENVRLSERIFSDENPLFTIRRHAVFFSLIQVSNDCLGGPLEREVTIVTDQFPANEDIVVINPQLIEKNIGPFEFDKGDGI